MDGRTTYIMSAFVLGWSKHWKEPLSPDKVFDVVNPDLFRETIMRGTEGRDRERFNRSLADLFGEVVTKVKTFPTSDGTWIILDKYTKRLLHKDVKNENEVNLLCKSNGYLR